MAELELDQTALTSAQQERLEKLTSEVLVNRVTVSFSIEGRANDGTKRSAFVSLSVEPKEGAQWSLDDTAVIRLVLCKRVVQATYADAVRRGVLQRSAVVEELPPVLFMHDRAIQQALSRGE